MPSGPKPKEAPAVAAGLLAHLGDPGRGRISRPGVRLREAGPGLHLADRARRPVSLDPGSALGKARAGGASGDRPEAPATSSCGVAAVKTWPNVKTV